MMTSYLLNFPEWQKDSVRCISEKTGYSMAEVMRRILERGLQDRIIYDVFPVISGQTIIRVQQ